MIVYRVEASFSIISSEGYHLTNLGPYTGRDRVKQITGKALRLTMSLDCAPEPDDDGLNESLNGLHYGFKSLSDVASWFSGCTMSLSESGYYVVAYDCPDEYVNIGGKQVQFRLSKSTPIRHYDRKEYLAEAKRERYGNRTTDLVFRTNC